MIIRPDTKLFIQLDRRTDARTYITKLIAALAVFRTRVRRFIAACGSQQQKELNYHLVAQLDTNFHTFPLVVVLRRGVRSRVIWR